MWYRYSSICYVIFYVCVFYIYIYNIYIHCNYIYIYTTHIYLYISWVGCFRSPSKTACCFRGRRIHAEGLGSCWAESKSLGGEIQTARWQETWGNSSSSIATVVFAFKPRNGRPSPIQKEQEIHPQCLAQDMAAADISHSASSWSGADPCEPFNSRLSIFDPTWGYEAMMLNDQYAWDSWKPPTSKSLQSHCCLVCAEQLGFLRSPDSRIES
jgi:hypothetical protein